MTKNQDIIQYCRDHMITRDVWVKYGLATIADGIVIPVLDPEGKRLFSKYRMFSGPDKYRYDRGSTMALFNAHLITPEVDEVWVVEGEFDAMALTEYFAGQNGPNGRVGVSVAVASTGGAGSWNSEWNALLKGKRVNILLDSDDAGMHGMFRLWEKIGTDVVFLYLWCMSSKYKDVCECLHEEGTLSKSVVLGFGSEFSYHRIASSKSPRTKVTAINSIFSMIDEAEARGIARAYVWDFKEHLKKILDREKPRKKKEVDYSGADGELEMIRMVPIDRFVKFDRDGLAPCVFHSDRKPSMHWNGPEHQSPKLRNTVKCFSCGRFAGVVDVVMEINSCTFPEALETIKKHL